MSSRPLARLLMASLAAGALVAAPLAVVPAQAATAAPAAATASTWKPRPAQYTATTSVKDLAIPMSDGVKLRGDLTLPANADGTPIGAKVPVVVTITAYNKTVIAGGFGGTLAGADPAYLVKRGYGQLTVDARGTGSSEGQWNAFDKRENQDAAEVMTWAHKQPWSQRQHRDDRCVVHGHQPDLRRRRQARGSQGDLPAGPGCRRLPRRRGLRRPDRLRLHAAVAGPGHGDGSDPSGRGRHRPAVGHRRARLTHRWRRRVHRPDPGQGAGRPGDGVRRTVLRRALPDQRDRQGRRADVPGRR